MGGNFAGSNFPGGTFPGANFPEGNFLGGGGAIFLEPSDEYHILSLRDFTNFVN